MTDFKLHEEVRVLGYSILSTEGEPPGGWPGEIVHLTAKQVHIKYGDIGRVDIFGRENQRALYGGIARRFRTMPQVAEHARRTTALEVLREYLIIRDRRATDPRDFTTDQLEALAEVVKTFRPPPGDAGRARRGGGGRAAGVDGGASGEVPPPPASRRPPVRGRLGW
jgi:hypothetical protein